MRISPLESIKFSVLITRILQSNECELHFYNKRNFRKNPSDKKGISLNFRRQISPSFQNSDLNQSRILLIIANILFWVPRRSLFYYKNEIYLLFDDLKIFDSRDLLRLGTIGLLSARRPNTTHGYLSE